MNRVTVLLREVNPEDPVHFLAEWVHEIGYSANLQGVELAWSDGTTTFVPWQAVLRIDTEPCACF